MDKLYTVPLDRAAMVIAVLCSSLLLLATDAVQAAAAPWYQWRHQQSRELYCSQLPPGEGWRQVEGPFRDAACHETGRPGQPRR
jgi:hypothetical protein